MEVGPVGRLGQRAYKISMAKNLPTSVCVRVERAQIPNLTMAEPTAKDPIHRCDYMFTYNSNTLIKHSAMVVDHLSLQ